MVGGACSNPSGRQIPHVVRPFRGVWRQAQLAWILARRLPEAHDMAQTAEKESAHGCLLAWGMTARWSAPHRLPGLKACCDPGYARAVTPAAAR
jgi:hypothetical protein